MLKAIPILLAILLCAAQLGRSDDITVVSQTLGVIGDYLTTSVGIGDPPQYFDLHLDVSDDKLVVLDVQTSDADLDYQYDYIKNLFVPEESDSLQLSDNICRRGYRSGTNVYHVDGIYGSDILTLGGLTFRNTSVRFCDLNKERDGDSTYNDPINWLMLMPIDGFLGIKPGGEDVLQKIGLPARKISFYVNSKPSETDNAGVITFGGPDTTNCGKFSAFPTDDSDTWRSWVTDVKFNSKTTSGTFSTRFDLTNKTLIVPKDTYNSIVNYFGGSTSYIVCNNYKNVPDMTMTIFGTDFSYPIQRILKPMQSSTYCQLDIDSSSDSDDDQIVLNRYILDKYCMMFDYDASDIALADLAK